MSAVVENAKTAMTPPPRNGGQILVDQLKIHDVDMAFCVPGESYLPVLDALYKTRDRIKLITTRHEGGAVNMAEAYGKLTGNPGICMVTRGPGATNASIGVHTAFQDSTPMILFIGQVGSDFIEREAFQEIDYRRMFGQMAKWVAQIDRADRIPEFIARAFQVATSGRMGPVVLALPEDTLSSVVEVADALKYQHGQANAAIGPSPGESALARISGLLAEAERPFVMVGGSGWGVAACADLQHFAETQNLPIGCTFRFQDLLDNEHPNYAGDVGIGINPKLAARIKEADVVLCIGARLGEMTTGGYTLFESPIPRQRLIHVHAGAEELGRVYQAELMVNSTVSAFARAIAAMPRVTKASIDVRTTEARREYSEWQDRRETPGAVQMWDVMQHLKSVLPRDAILTNGAGNYASWVHRFYRYGGFRTQLAPTSGAMGYGVPAAIAAKAVYPQRTVVCFAGDGCFLMTGQELATVMQYQLNVIFIVVNNGMYGTIRMHQEREFPGHVHGTALVNPDFAAFAKSFGAYGEVVEKTSEFAAAFERAIKAARPALIEVRIDAEAITPNATLSAIRAAGEAAMAAKEL